MNELEKLKQEAEELRAINIKKLEQFIDNAIYLGDKPCDIAEMVFVVIENQNKHIINELKATIDSIKNEVLSMESCKNINTGYEPSISCFQRSIDLTILQAHKTPSQHLTDIKADAIIAMANEETTVGRMRNDTLRSFVFVSDIHDYAEKLRNK
jgi:sugar-specific transcriptional regulator TrmB